MPDEATKITAMIDVHGDVLYYGLVAWTNQFTGWVIDYGTWPKQNQRYFEKASAQRTLAKVYPKEAKESTAALLHKGLGDLTLQILGRSYRREDGTQQHVDLCMIDANWGPETNTVYEFCKLSPFREKLLPSHGKPMGINKPAIHDKPRGRGEIVGFHWRMPSLAKTTKTIRYINFTPNEWKRFLFERLAASRGSVGCLELPGNNPEFHLMLADHCHAETPEAATGTFGDRVLFSECPPGVDNHLFDVLVGCCVGASREGCALPGVAMNSRGSRKNKGRKRLKLSAM